MNARLDVRHAQTHLAVIEGQYRLSAARLQRAAIDLANAELALTLAKARMKRATRQAKPRRRPFAWIESWFFILTGLVVATLLLWARAQGWVA